MTRPTDCKEVFLLNELKERYDNYIDKHRKKRYGFVYVDKKDDGTGTYDRFKKDSFYWYKKVIETNGDFLL